MVLVAAAIRLDEVLHIQNPWLQDSQPEQYLVWGFFPLRAISHLHRLGSVVTWSVKVEVGSQVWDMFGGPHAQGKQGN